MREAVVVASSRTALGEILSRFIQHDASGRSGRALH